MFDVKFLTDLRAAHEPRASHADYAAEDGERRNMLTPYQDSE